MPRFQPSGLSYLSSREFRSLSAGQDHTPKAGAEYVELAAGKEEKMSDLKYYAILGEKLELAGQLLLVFEEVAESPNPSREWARQTIVYPEAAT